MSKKNNLVEIAEILIEMKEARELHGVPTEIMGKYPEGSKPITIDQESYIVLNNTGEEALEEENAKTSLTDSNIKYNPNFFLGTYESHEPEIIDEAHNKSKLINEAYTEVSFLPKTIESEMGFDEEKAKKAVSQIIDKSYYSIKDFDGFQVVVRDSNKYSTTDYDEVYRCRCVFADISGNESVDSILIMAYRVSEEKGNEYNYQVIDSENIKTKLEDLELTATKNNFHTSYTDIEKEEYNDIRAKIDAAIRTHYNGEENKKKHFRLIRVDVKAIYCVRFKKTPINVALYSGNKMISQYETFFSLASSDFNRFTCPTCLSVSSAENAISIHVDHDFLSGGARLSTNASNAIGCTCCMQRCRRCNAWHFKRYKVDPVTNVRTDQYRILQDKGYKLIPMRRFLSSLTGKNVDITEYCDCKRYLTWIYDEMSEFVQIDDDRGYTRVISKFLNGNCGLVFINYLTGEKIADYNDYISYLYDYLLRYLGKYEANFRQQSKDSSNKELRGDALKKNMVHTFVNQYLINRDDVYNGLDLARIIADSIKDYKMALANLFNISESLIKTTSQSLVKECKCCKGEYYCDEGAYKEETTETRYVYYNSTKELCCCCNEAIGYNLRIWTRADDGVTFYRSKRRAKKAEADLDKLMKYRERMNALANGADGEAPKGKEPVVEAQAIRTYLTPRGEEIYDKWLADAKGKISAIHHTTKKGGVR